MPAKRCPTCLRPVFVPRPPTETRPDQLRHCPRALAEPLSIESDQVYTVACLAIGITTRDAALVAARTRTRQLLAAIDDALAEAEDAEADGG